MRKAGRAGQMFLPPPGVILGATGVYRCDKGLFARGFCVFRVCTKVCTDVCMKWLRVQELMVDSRGGRRESEV